MSLVAYGSSDEGSDGEMNSTNEQRRIACSEYTDSFTKQDQDEASLETTPKEKNRSANSGSGLKLPAPKSSTKSDINKDVNPSQDILKSLRKNEKLASFLPPPKKPASAMSAQVDTSPNEVVLAGVEVDEDDDEIIAVEEYVPLKKEAKVTKDVREKPRSVGGMFSLLSLPWESGIKEASENSGKDGVYMRKSKQPVKIAVPTAPKAGSDEEMNDEPVAKKPKASKAGSGLSTLLPKPKHSVTVKANNRNRPSVKLTNRPLIPYRLTKKRTAGKESKKEKHQEDDDHSSDEDEPVSFFTFHEKAEETANESSREVISADQEVSIGKSSTVTTLPLGVQNTSKSAPEPTPSSSTSSPGRGPHYRTIPTGVVVSASQSATVAHDYQGVSSSSDLLDTQAYYYGQQGAHEQQFEVSSSGQYANYPTYEQSGYSNTESYHNQTDYTTESYPTSGVESQEVTAQEALDVQKLKRLQGRKNRGEEINIVDIDAADQVGDTSAIRIRQKSEEIAPRPSTKKGDMPSSQQRRKHQITYLAFQAKEREHELRQQWATNSQTRRQTQSKYGF